MKINASQANELIKIINVLYDDPDREVKWALARFLCHQDNVDKNELEKILQNFTRQEKDTDINFAANFSLKILKGEKLEFQLKRKELVSDLIKISDPRIIDSPEYTEKLYELRECISRYKLYSFTSPSDISPDLLKRLRRHPYLLIQELIMAIIDNRDKIAQKVFHDILSSLSKDEKEGVKWALAFCFKSLHLTEEDLDAFHDVIINLMTDRHFWVKREICTSLGYLGSDVDSQLLSTINDLREDGYEEVRIAANSLYKKLTGD